MLISVMCRISYECFLLAPPSPSVSTMNLLKLNVSLVALVDGIRDESELGELDNL